MPVRETSLAVFASIAEKLPFKRRQVYKVICEFGNISDQEIANVLKVPLHHVSPRRGELEASRAVVSVGTKTVNGKKVLLWDATGEFYQARKRESKADYYKRLYMDKCSELEKLKDMAKITEVTLRDDVDLRAIQQVMFEFGD